MLGEIIARIRQNDQRAMRQFYQLYVGELTSVCRRYVPDADEAKDVLQNSFVKIFKSLPTVDYRGEKAFRGWLHKIVANESLLYLRDRKRQSFAEQTADKEDTVESGEDPDPEQITPDELHQLIRELPDGYRTVLNLYVFENYSHRQIAEMLGIRESTSASQLHYAKQWLARRINEMKKKRG